MVCLLHLYLIPWLETMLDLSCKYKYVIYYHKNMYTLVIWHCLFLANRVASKSSKNLQQELFRYNN